MAYSLTLLAGLALVTALYHLILFWQRERTVRRLSTIIVWLSAFATCTFVVVQAGEAWRSGGLWLLSLALFVQNIICWRAIFRYMQQEAGSAAVLTLADMTDVDEPVVIEATKKE